MQAHRLRLLGSFLVSLDVRATLDTGCEACVQACGNGAVKLHPADCYFTSQIQIMS